MSVLELNHVKKSFNNGTLHVLKDISLSVEKGEVVALSLIHISEPTRP